MLCCDLVAYLRTRGNIFEILLQHDRFSVWTDEVNLKTANLEKEKTVRQSLQRLRTSVFLGNEIRNNGDSNDVAQTNLFHVCFTIYYNPKSALSSHFFPLLGNEATLKL